MFSFETKANHLSCKGQRSERSELPVYGTKITPNFCMYDKVIIWSLTNNQYSQSSLRSLCSLRWTYCYSGTVGWYVWHYRHHWCLEICDHLGGTLPQTFVFVRFEHCDERTEVWNDASLWHCILSCNIDKWIVSKLTPLLKVAGGVWP